MDNAQVFIFCWLAPLRVKSDAAKFDVIKTNHSFFGPVVYGEKYFTFLLRKINLLSNKGFTLER